VQIVTGVVLAMHYVPNANLAFDSVENIMRDVNYGWLLRYVHENGASMFFLAVYVHMFRASTTVPTRRRARFLDPGRHHLSADGDHVFMATCCPGPDVVLAATVITNSSRRSTR